jgi:PadR family transcriptional regulator, regulatory protein PadR
MPWPQICNEATTSKNPADVESTALSEAHVVPGYVAIALVDCLPESGLCCGGMSTRSEARGGDRERIALLQGTLDLLVLRTLVFGPQHGHGIARAIETQSEEVLLVDHGSLYPALQRLEERGLIDAQWGVSDNNRRARFYTLTKTGRKQLTAQTRQWRRLSAIIGTILGPEEA